MRIDELKSEIGQSDESFDRAVRMGLDGLDTIAKPVKRKPGLVIGIAVVAVMLVCVAVLTAGNGWPVILQSLPASTPEAEALVQPSQSATYENDDVRFVVGEAIYDGYTLYAAVEVFPKTDDVVLLSLYEIESDAPATMLGVEASEDMTVTEYCKENNLRMIKTNVTFDVLETSEVMRYMSYTDITYHSDGSQTWIIDTVCPEGPENVCLNCSCVDYKDYKHATDNPVWYEDVPLHIIKGDNHGPTKKACQLNTMVYEEESVSLDGAYLIQSSVDRYLEVDWSTNSETPVELDPHPCPGGAGTSWLFTVELVRIDDMEQDPYAFKIFPIVEKNQTDGRTHHRHVWKLNPDMKLQNSVEVEIEVFRQFWVDEQIGKESLGRYTLTFK